MAKGIIDVIGTTKFVQVKSVKRGADGVLTG